MQNPVFSPMSIAEIALIECVYSNILLHLDFLKNCPFANIYIFFFNSQVMF